MVDLDFFSSPIGLGHITRDIAIAANFEGISTRFITGSSAAQLSKQTGFDVDSSYVPPQFVIKSGSLQNTTKWLWNYYQYYKKCKSISSKIIRKDDPGLVVSDEDFASLSVAQDMGLPTVLVTDVLETRFTKGMASFVEKKMNRAMTKIIEKCDAVIIPESGNDTGNIHRIGSIVRQTSIPRDKLRERFSFDKETVLVSVGGTDAGKFLIDRVLKVAPKIKHDADVVLVSGPSLKARSGHIRDLGFVDNLHELILAADVLVSLAGKSTIDEANAYGTPGIFIPIKGHFEQEDNAKAEGFVFEDIDNLESLILEKLKQERRPNTTGAAHAASQIIQNLL